MREFNKELFDRKITYKDWLTDMAIKKASIPINYNGVITLAFWNNPRNYYKVKKLFPNAKVIIIEEDYLKDLYNIPKEDIIYINLEKELFPIMKYKDNYIIANPPYGKIGANITKKIIDTVDYVEYINLLPANDYKRNDTKDLFNYQSDMVSIKDGFADAAVTTHLARIHKTKVNDLTLDEFERSTYIDRSLDKYFAENSKRKHKTFDSIQSCGLTRAKAEEQNWDIRKTFIIGLRDMNHRHLPYSKACDTYKWNAENVGEVKTLPGSKTQLFVGVGEFNSELEKQNFVEFIYSTIGFKWLCKIFTAINCDGTVHGEVFPKVDWARSWTVEEILADYGYTETEIQEVMNDLVNYKGMED